MHLYVHIIYMWGTYIIRPFRRERSHCFFLDWRNIVHWSCKINLDSDKQTHRSQCCLSRISILVLEKKWRGIYIPTMLTLARNLCAVSIACVCSQCRAGQCLFVKYTSCYINTFISHSMIETASAGWVSRTFSSYIYKTISL